MATTATTATTKLASHDNRLEDFLAKQEVEEFFSLEADLLDGRKFEAWLDLLHEDIRYWMPLARNFEFGKPEIEYTREGKDLNWFDEGKFELEQRVKQILVGNHWAEEPLSRTSHLFANLRITAKGEDWAETRCRFVIYRNRTEGEQDFFVGKRNDKLVRVNGSWRLIRRHIYLDQSVLLAKNLTIFF